MPTNQALLVWNQTDPGLQAAIIDALDDFIPGPSLTATPPNAVVVQLRGNGNSDFTVIAGVMFSVQSQNPGFAFVLLGTNPSFFVSS
jgi:hypothetical protein